MAGFKLAVASVLGATVWQFASAGWEALAHNVALELAVFGAGLVGAREVWRRVIKPAWWTVRKIDAVYEAVRDLPAWREQIDRRMADGAEHFDRLDAELAAWASADRVKLSAKIDELQDPRGRA